MLDCGGNCVGPSLSVSRELGVSFACLGFLNGFVTELTFLAEQALALDCQPRLSILQSNTQTKITEKEPTRQGRVRQGQTNTRKRGGRSGCGRHFLNL